MVSIIGLTGYRSIMRGNWSSPLVGSTDRCSRCGGLMVYEWGADPMENAGQRCVQCGELVDSVTLYNRRLQQTGMFSLDSK